MKKQKAGFRKLRNKMNHTEVYYTVPSWPRKEIDGKTFVPVVRQDPSIVPAYMPVGRYLQQFMEDDVTKDAIYKRGKIGQSIFYMSQESLEYIL